MVFFPKVQSIPSSWTDRLLLDKGRGETEHLRSVFFTSSTLLISFFSEGGGVNLKLFFLLKEGIHIHKSNDYSVIFHFLVLLLIFVPH